MPTQINKEWGAIDGDEIVLKADNKEELERSLRDEGYEVSDLDIVALPKSHSSMFV